MIRTISAPSPANTPAVPASASAINGGLDGEGWRASALCAETDPEAFFPEKGRSTAEPKKVCMRCPVRVQCLEYALRNDENFGIWGGLSSTERNRLKRKQGDKAPTASQLRKQERDKRIVQMRRSGLDVIEIAERVGVSDKTVYRVLERQPHPVPVTQELGSAG